MLQFFLGILCCMAASTVIFLLLLISSGKDSAHSNPAKRHKQINKLSDKLMKNIAASLHPCRDTAWINIIMQRIWAEMSSNETYRRKAAISIEKSFGALLESGYIKEVSVTDLKLGQEAPYITNIRILTRGEQNEISASRNTKKTSMSKLKRYLLRALGGKTTSKKCEGKNVDPKNEGEHAISFYECTDHLKANEDLYREKSDDTSISSLHEEAHLQDLCPAHFENIFENATFIADVHYNGGYSVDTSIRLSKKLSIYSKLKINGFAEKMLLRVPALESSTRYEYCFLDNPAMDISISSQINGGKNNGFLVQSVNKLIKMALGYSFTNYMVYPKWYQYCFGFVSSKDLLHNNIKIGPENIDYISHSALELISFTGNDFKLAKRHDGVALKKASCSLNGEDNFFSATIYFSELENDACSPNTKIAVRNYFTDKNSFPRIFSKLQGASLLYGKDDFSIFKVTIANTEIEFTRAILQGYVVLQCNQDESSDFIVCKICQDHIVLFYKLSENQNYSYDLGEVLLLKHELQKHIKTHILVEEASAESSSSHAHLLIDNILEYMSFKPEFVCTKSIAFDYQLKLLRDCLFDHHLRFKMVNGVGRASALQTVMENCVLFQLEDADGNNSAALPTYMYGYHDEQHYIDATQDGKSFFVYQAKEHGCGSALHITFPVLQRAEFLSRFVSELEFKLRLASIFDSIAVVSQFSALKGLRKELKVGSGSLYINFDAEMPCSIRLKIFSCKYKRIVYDIKHIAGNGSFQALIPTQSDFLKIYMQPIFPAAKNIGYKLEAIPSSHEMYINTNIKIRRKSKQVFPIKGFPSFTVHWNVHSINSFAVYLLDLDSKVQIESNGIFNTENKEYWFVIKNLEAKEIECSVRLGLHSIS
ncbi:hypothetical protein ENBRE01_0014 [Enteropsectra breve]|nr:hypothetical protein ENBRE01_0014 [Enteropsectra breve]